MTKTCKYSKGKVHLTDNGGRLLSNASWENKIDCPLVLSNARYAHQNEVKLDPNERKYVFLGWGEEVKGYRLWLNDIGDYKVIISRNVLFNELHMPCQNKSCRNQTLLVSKR